MNKSIVNAINTVLLKTKFTVPEESIMTGIVTYKQINKQLTYNSDVGIDMLSLTKEYVNIYASVVSSMNKKYVAYAVMLQKIKNYNLTSFLDVNDTICNELYQIYLDKTETCPFSCISYKTAMYNIGDLSWNENERMSKIHFDIMVPLVRYCMDKYGVREHDINIHSAISLSDTPGKGILFDINGVTVNMLVNDVYTPSLGISGKIYQATAYDNKCLIIVK